MSLRCGLRDVGTHGARRDGSLVWRDVLSHRTSGKARRQTHHLQKTSFLFLTIKTPTKSSSDCACLRWENVSTPSTPIKKLSGYVCMHESLHESTERAALPAYSCTFSCRVIPSSTRHLTPFWNSEESVVVHGGTGREKSQWFCWGGRDRRLRVRVQIVACGPCGRKTIRLIHSNSGFYSALADLLARTHHHSADEGAAAAGGGRRRSFVSVVGRSD